MDPQQLRYRLMEDEEPEECIVNNCVDVLCKGPLPVNSDQGALFYGRVEEQVAVHKEALICVPRPHPVVPLDAVQKELPAVEVEGICGGLPDPVNELVPAGERAPALQGQVLVLCSYLCPRVADPDIPKGTGREL